MNRLKIYLLSLTTLSVLSFGATMLTTKAYALDNSSSNVTNPSTTNGTTSGTTTDSTSTINTTPDTSTTLTPSETATTSTSPNEVTDNTSTAPQTTSNDSSSTLTDPTTSSSTVNNNIQSDAQSGTSTVSNSSQAGDASTGNASSTANLINSIQSSSNLSGSNLQTFTDNINGNYTGNLTINPLDFITTTSSQPDPPNVTDNISSSETINNTVDLTANSGDATLENNGTAGNATTGNAITEANIINLINSDITDNQSFLGVININGNLSGNILIPSSLFSNQLTPTSIIYPSNTSINSINTENVNNAVTLLAQTGNSSEVSNGNSGNATTGNATTNLNIYDLINNQIVGGNLLLVFINVSGTWVGLLMNEPVGTTMGAFGANISQDNQITPASTVNSFNTETINNYLYLQSTSGNALSTYNQSAGNATSGNATANANIANILGDQINLSGWLGILIINVFGSWNGSLMEQPVNLTTSNVSSDPIVLIDVISNNHSSSYTVPYKWVENNIQNSSINTQTQGTQVPNIKDSIGNFASSIPRPSDPPEKTGLFSGLVGIISLIAAGVVLAGERIISILTRQ